MPVTLIPSAKILLDLTLVPAKRVLQEMERHALVRFLSFWLVVYIIIQTFLFFQQHKNKMCLIITYKLSSSNDGSAPSCLVPIVDSFFSSSSFSSYKSFVRVSSLLFKPSVPLISVIIQGHLCWRLRDSKKLCMLPEAHAFPLYYELLVYFFNTPTN